MSATSVSEIAIKLGLDDASMVAGLSRAKSQAHNWSKDMVKLMTVSGKVELGDVLAQNKILEGVNKLAEQSLKEQISLTQKLAAERDNAYNTAHKAASTSIADQEKLRQIELDALKTAILRRGEEERIANLKQATANASGVMVQGMSVSGTKVSMIDTMNTFYVEQRKQADDILKLERENNVELQKQIAARITLRNIRMSEQGAIDKRNTASQENEAKREAIMLLKSAEGETNKLLKLDTRLRQEAMEFKKVLDAANLSLTDRNAIVQRFLAAQAAIRKEAVGLSPQELALQKRDNDLKRDAIALKNLIASAEQRHTIRLAEYNDMLKATLITQEEYDRAVQHSLMVRDASNKGFGAMSGALTQASFAAEDFIQVLSMGGGLNMALMSASNNLSMVARALAPTSGAIGALVGVGIPALLIGLGMAATHFLKTKDAAEEMKKAMDEVNERFKDFGKMTQLRLKMQFNTEDTKAISDVNALEEQRTALLREEKQLKIELTKQDVVRDAKNKAAIESMLGGEEALAEMRDILDRSIQNGNEEQRSTSRATKALLDAAMAAAVQGKGITALEKLKELYDSLPSAAETFFVGADYSAPGYDPALINALDDLFGGGMLGTEVDVKRMQELLDTLVDPTIELTDEQRKQLEITQALLDLKMREQEIIDETMQRSRSASERAALDLKNKQEEISFMMQANDLEKEKLSIQQQQMEFMGIQEGDLSSLSAAQAAAGIEFLKVYADNLGKDIAETQKAGMPTAQGALEQDALKAQANAFDQVLKAATKKPDPQLERSNKLLEAIREAIANGGTFQFVQ